MTFNKTWNFHYEILKPWIAKILKRSDYGGYKNCHFHQRKQMKIALMNENGKDKLLNPLLITLVCCLMMAKRLHVCEMGIKFAALRMILLVIMMSFYENVHLSNILTVVIPFSLVLWPTTQSLDWRGVFQHWNCIVGTLLCAVTTVYRLYVLTLQAFWVPKIYSQVWRRHEPSIIKWKLRTD